MKFSSLLIFLLAQATSGNEISALEIAKYKQNPKLYYGEDFLTNKSSNTNKEDLHIILNSPHQITEAGADIIGLDCRTDDCYEHRVLGYKEARKILFGEINYLSTNASDEVYDFYCQKSYKDGQFVNGNQFEFHQGQIPNSQIINTEHLWPKSHFGVSEESNKSRYEMMVSDIHHLLPTDTIVNRDRYNHKFGEVIRVTKKLPCKGSLVGITENNSETFFEPPTQIKGDIARSIFYFSTKYNLPIDDNEEVFLRFWHIQDKVSELEIERNNIIHKYQGIRNPFIDFPELTQEIKDF